MYTQQKSDQLQIFSDTVRHKGTGRFLFYAEFIRDLDRNIRERFKISTEISLRDYFGMYNPVLIRLEPPEGYEKPDFGVYYKDISISGKSFINELGVLEVPGSMYHFTQYISPLRNATDFKELESYPYYDFSRHIDNNMGEKVDSAHKAGRVAVCWVGHMYEDAWQIRGYEQFLEDMLLQPEWCEYILDRIMEKNLISAKAAARSGVDVLTTGDDVANQRALMFSPEKWRKMMKVRWAKVYEAARSIKPDIQILYHSDGNIGEIIPDLIEIGVTVLNPIQPECMDLCKIKSKYGDKIVMDGTIGTQSTMPFGTPRDVKINVKDRIKQLGYDGALILSPTHVLEPEVPIDNIIAFVEAVKGVNG